MKQVHYRKTKGEAFHRIVKVGERVYSLTQVSLLEPEGGYITQTIELESRIERLLAASEKVKRAEFIEKMKEVFNYLK